MALFGTSLMGNGIMQDMMKMSLLGNIQRMGAGLMSGRNWQQGLSQDLGNMQMPNFGNMMQLQMAMQQQERQQAQQAAAARLAADPSLMSTREGQSLLMSAYPEIYAKAAIEQRFRAAPTATERDKLRSDLESMGYTPDQIMQFMVNRDRYQFTTDMFGNRTVFDRYAGTPIGGTTAPTTGLMGTAPTPPPEGVPTLTEGFEAGTGASGFFGNIANTITDALGMGLVAPQAEKAKTALDTLQTRTMLNMTAAIPGRESNLVREELRRLAVEPASLLTGDERALDRLTQTRGMISEERNRLRGVLDEPEGYKPEDLAAARANLSQLDEIQRTYDHIIGNWRPGSAGAPGQPMEVRSKDEYDKLPSGTQFIAPDGSIRVKP